MAGGGADPTEPVDIRYDHARARLEIDWADGVTTAYRYEFLRWKCPCAECAGEMGMPGRLQFVDALTPDQFRMTAIEGVGNYAVRPTWADGHDTGLYTLRNLRALGESSAIDISAAVGIDGPRGRP